MMTDCPHWYHATKDGRGFCPQCGETWKRSRHSHADWCLIRYTPPEVQFCDCGAEPRLSKEAMAARRAES